MIKQSLFYIVFLLGFLFVLSCGPKDEETPSDTEPTPLVEQESAGSHSPKGQEEKKTAIPRPSKRQEEKKTAISHPPERREEQKLNIFNSTQPQTIEGYALEHCERSSAAVAKEYFKTESVEVQIKTLEEQTWDKITRWLGNWFRGSDSRLLKDFYCSFQVTVNEKKPLHHGSAHILVFEDQSSAENIYKEENQIMDIGELNFGSKTYYVVAKNMALAKAYGYGDESP